MIYIWDNGLHYSSHEIRFIENDSPDYERIGKIITYNRIHSKIIAKAEKFDWLDEDYSWSLSHHISPNDFFNSKEQTLNYEFVELAKPYLKEMTQGWQELKRTGMALDLLIEYVKNTD